MLHFAMSLSVFLLHTCLLEVLMSKQQGQRLFLLLSWPQRTNYVPRRWVLPVTVYSWVDHKSSWIFSWVDHKSRWIFIGVDYKSRWIFSWVDYESRWIFRLGTWPYKRGSDEWSEYTVRACQI